VFHFWCCLFTRFFKDTRYTLTFKPNLIPQIGQIQYLSSSQIVVYVHRNVATGQVGPAGGQYRLVDSLAFTRVKTEVVWPVERHIPESIEIKTEWGRCLEKWGLTGQDLEDALVAYRSQSGGAATFSPVTAKIEKL
jgi:hypothetical protein